MKPRAVVFDLGKVLVDFDWTRAARNLARHSSVEAVEIHRILLSTPPLYQYETGLLETAEFVSAMKKAIGFQADDEIFGRYFSDIFTPIVPMIELQSELRSIGVPVYIFSNTNDLAIRFVRREYPFFRNFNGYVLSYEHKSMKPQARLYEVVEEMTGFSGAEILYLDDRPENVEAGQARGWQTVLHAAPEATRAFLQRLALVR